jgi:hypothetical protein
VAFSAGGEAAENRLSFRRNPRAPFAAAIVIFGTISVVPRGLKISRQKEEPP